MLENKRKLGLRSVDKPVGDGRLQFHLELSSTQHKEKKHNKPNISRGSLNKTRSSSREDVQLFNVKNFFPELIEWPLFLNDRRWFNNLVNLVKHENNYPANWKSSDLGKCFPSTFYLAILVTLILYLQIKSGEKEMPLRKGK